jgi:type IV pilus assembly protein PilF
MDKRLRAFCVALLCTALAGCQSAQQTATKPVNERAKLAALNTEIAVQYMQNREFQTAKDKLDKALELDPHNVDTHNTLGLLYAVLAENDKAEAAFKKALSIEPNNSSALNNYGQFLCQRKRFDEGEKMFMKAVENPLYRNAESAYNNAGVCAMAAGKLENAETYFRRALEIDPTLAPALLPMADISLLQSRGPQASAYLKRYFEVGPRSPRALWLGVQIARLNADRDAEASLSLELERTFPDSPQTKLLLDSRPQ